MSFISRGQSMRQLTWLNRTTIVLLLALCSGAWAGIVQDPAATTQLDHRRRVLEFNRRTLVDAYDKVGVRDPRWDTLAKRALGMMALRFTNAGQEQWSRLEGEASPQEILAAVRVALDAGCADPLVLYCQAVILSDMGQTAEARPHFRKAFEGIAASDYTPHRKAAAASQILGRFDAASEPELHARAVQVQRDQHLAMFRGEGWEPEEVRFVYENVWAGVYDKQPLEVQRAMFQAVQGSDGVDPWLADMIAGTFHIRQAWADRGSGWAHTVTEEGWRGFERNMKLAARHFQAACERQPQYPEAATRMITVAMAGHAGPGQTPRLWFDRAVKAQFDHPAAYTQMCWSLRPRWGGSHQQLYAFGVECLETARFDTRVPYVLLLALQDMAEDNNGDWGFLQSPQIFESVRKMFEGYVAVTVDEVARADFASHLAGLAWRAGRYSDAKSLLDTLGENVRPRMIARVHPRVDEVISEVYLKTGPQAAEVTRLEQLPAADHKGRAEGWAQVASQLPEGDRGQFLARARAVEWRDMDRLAAGEAVDITALEAFQLISGKWSVDDQGRLVGSSLPRGRALLLYRPKVGQHYEYSGRYEILTADDVPNPAAAVVFAYASRVPWYELYPSLDPQQAILQSSRGHRRRVDGMVPATGDFVVRVTGKKVAVTIDGHEVTSDWEMTQGVEQVDRQIGLAMPAGPGHRVAYSQLKVRRLDVNAPQP